MCDNFYSKVETLHGHWSEVGILKKQWHWDSDFCVKRRLVPYWEMDWCLYRLSALVLQLFFILRASDTETKSSLELNLNLRMQIGVSNMKWDHETTLCSMSGLSSFMRSLDCELLAWDSYSSAKKAENCFMEDELKLSTTIALLTSIQRISISLWAQISLWRSFRPFWMWHTSRFLQIRITDWVSLCRSYN